MFWASNISMFALLPLAYFYHEAAGFGTHFKSTWWRMCEAAVLWVLFSAILGGFVYLARSLYTTTHSSPDYSPFAYSLMSLLGSLFILWYTPGGIVVLGRASTNLFRTYKVLVPANRQELLFEKDALTFKLFKLETQQRLGEEASQARFSSSPSYSPYSSPSSSSGAPSPSSTHILPPNPTDTIWTKFSLLPTHKRSHSWTKANAPFPAVPSEEARLYSQKHRNRAAGSSQATGDWLDYTPSHLTSARSLQRASKLQQQLIRNSASKSKKKISTSWDADDDWDFPPPPSPGEFLPSPTRTKSPEVTRSELTLPNGTTLGQAKDNLMFSTSSPSSPTGFGASSIAEGNGSRTPFEDENIVFQHEAITPELLEREEYSTRKHSDSQQHVENLRWILQHSSSVSKSTMGAALSRRNAKSRTSSDSLLSGSPDNSESPLSPEDLASRIYHNQDAVTQEVDWLEAQKEYASITARLKLVQRELSKYEAEPEKVTILSSFRWMVRNLLAMVLSAVNLVLPLLLFVRAMDVQLRPYLATEGAVYYYSFLYPDERSSTVWFTSEIALIVYLTVAAFSGFFSSRFMERFRPQRHNTGMHKVIVSIFFSLVLASAIPVAGHLLGLISFDLMGAYDNLEFLQSQYLANFVQILFAVLLVKRYLEFFPWTNYLLRTVGRVFDWANSPFALS